MPADFQRYRTIVPRMPSWQYSAWMKLAENCFNFEKSDPAQFRHHILMHYYKHGYRATIDAFNISKSTLYRWKQEYEVSGKKRGLEEIGCGVRAWSFDLNNPVNSINPKSSINSTFLTISTIITIITN